MKKCLVFMFCLSVAVCLSSCLKSCGSKKDGSKNRAPDQSSRELKFGQENFMNENTDADGDFDVEFRLDNGDVIQFVRFRDENELEFRVRVEGNLDLNIKIYISVPFKKCNDIGDIVKTESKYVGTICDEELSIKAAIVGNRHYILFFKNGTIIVNGTIVVELAEKNKLTYTVSSNGTRFEIE